MKPKYFNITIIMAGLLAALFINYNQMLFSQFDLVPGYMGDQRLIIYLLNHWYSVFCGETSFFTVGFFYPDKLALGYSDAFFLFGVIYSLFRAFGFDYFSSLQLLFIFMTILGYLTSFFVFRRLLKLNLYFSILGSILFVSLNAIRLQHDHSQLLGFYVYPLLVIFLCLYISADKNTLKSWLSVAAFSLLLGLLFFTCYYAAWYFLFTLILFAVIYAIINSVDSSYKILFSNLWAFIKKSKFQLTFGILVFFVSLTPFLLTYLPVYFLRGSPPFEVFLKYSPSIKDVINVGITNYLWSPILGYIDSNFGENNVIRMGYPLVIFTCFLAYFFYYSISYYQKKYIDRPIIFSICLTALVIIILIVKLTYDFSLWYIIYKIVPGASGLRAVGRYMIVSQMLAVVVVVYELNQLYGKLKEVIPPGRQRLYIYFIAAFIVLGIVLVGEQYNTSRYGLKKSEQLSFLDKIQSPPSDCAVFFIKKIDEPKRMMKTYQTDAMMISMEFNIPTINGQSRYEPKGWRLNDPSSEDYYKNINLWLSNKRINYDNVCHVDIYNGEFNHITCEELLSVSKPMHLSKSKDMAGKIKLQFAKFDNYDVLAGEMLPGGMKGGYILKSDDESFVAIRNTKKPYTDKVTFKVKMTTHQIKKGYRNGYIRAVADNGQTIDAGVRIGAGKYQIGGSAVEKRAIDVKVNQSKIFNIELTIDIKKKQVTAIIDGKVIKSKIKQNFKAINRVGYVGFKSQTLFTEIEENY